MQETDSNRPCPKCGQPIPISVSVCHHCQSHLGFWGWLTNMSIVIGFLVAIVSIYSAFQTGADRRAVETALEQSKIALEGVKSENASRAKSNVAQRWDIFRSR